MDPATLAGLFDQAEEALPEECCGVLLGRCEAGSTSVGRALPAVNTASDPSRRFEISPEVLLRAHDQAREEGLEVVGYYHSHPDGVAVPSATDRAAAWPGVSYLILAVNGGRRREARSWRLLVDEGFNEECLGLRTWSADSRAGGSQWA